MTSPRVTRPRFPKGYVDSPKRFLDWSEVEGRLSEAIHYWLCSVRPDGRPHVVPKWAAWVDGRLYFDGSPETRHARNIAVNPNVNVHLEDGARAVILDGRARAIVPDGGLGQSLSRGPIAESMRRLGTHPRRTYGTRAACMRSRCSRSSPGRASRTIPRSSSSWNCIEWSSSKETLTKA